jgi:hypothetical protein
MSDRPMSAEAGLVDPLPDRFLQHAVGRVADAFDSRSTGLRATPGPPGADHAAVRARIPDLDRAVPGAANSAAEQPRSLR